MEPFYISELEKTVPTLLRTLEDDFQKIFGLNIEEKKS